jgi:hypothetical protein
MNGIRNEHSPVYTRTKQLAERVRSKSIPTEEGCLIYQGTNTHHGGGAYGVVWVQVGGKRWSVPARRVVYQAEYGDLYDRVDGRVMVVYASCGTHLCVKPEHLRARVGGIGGGSARVVSLEDVRFMRANHPRLSYSVLARQFGISYTSVRRIVKGKTYSWLESN